MNNESIIKKFMLKFIDDANMNILRESLAAGDTHAAFSAAHTLKGLCKNLSLVALDKVASDTTELLRAGNLEAAKELMPSVEDEYNRTVTIIKEIFA